MTPQPQQQGLRPAEGKKDMFPRAHVAAPQVLGVGRGQPVPGRFSLGGGEARRVIVQQPWKVRDLVVPSSGTSTGTALMPADPPASSLDLSNPSPIRPPPTPVRSSAAAGVTGTPLRARATPSVSEEEKKAIQERRRSAFKEVNFWVGGAPGMSPTKSIGTGSTESDSSSTVPSTSTSAASSRRNSTSPVKASSSRVFGSPTKGRPLAHAIAEEDDEGKSVAMHNDEEEELDTRGLLEKIKETVDNMTRRRSVVLGGAGSVLSTPQPTILATAGPSSRMSLGSGADSDTGVAHDMGVKKLDFTKIRTPAKPDSKGTSTPAAKPAFEDAEEGGDQASNETPFSLLRPGALEERRQTILAASMLSEEKGVETTVPIPLPIVVVDTAEDEEALPSNVPVKSAPGRSRLLRAPKPMATEVDDVSDVEIENGGEQVRISSFDVLCRWNFAESEFKSRLLHPSPSRLQSPLRHADKDQRHLSLQRRKKLDLKSPLLLPDELERVPSNLKSPLQSLSNEVRKPWSNPNWCKKSQRPKKK